MTSSAEKVKNLLRESVLDICRKQLTFYLHLEIRAEVEVIVDNQDSLSVYIDETVKSIHGQANNFEKKPTTTCHDPVRDIIEGSLFQQCGNYAKTGTGVIQLIKRETDNSLNIPVNWKTSKDSPPGFAQAELKQAGQNLDLVKKKSGLNSEQLMNDELLGQSDKVEIENINMMQLPTSYKFAQREIKVNGTDQSDAKFSSLSDPSYMTDKELQPTSAIENCQIDVSQNGSCIEQKQLSVEDIKALSVCTYLEKENGIYKCPKCEFLTDHGSAMNAHIKAHEKIIPCDHCKEMFSSVTVLKQHMYDEHGISNRRKVKLANSEFLCKYCGDVYTTIKEFSGHLSVEHNQQIAGCPYCDYVTVHGEDLPRHIKRQHRIGARRECKLCGVVCPDRRRLRLHMEKEHVMESGVVCELCGINVNGPLLLKIHMKTVHNKHRCPGCSYSSTQLESLEKHKCSNDKNRLCCKICLCTDFICITQLKKHMRQQHPIDHKKRQCDFCDKVFCSRQGLYVHRKVVHGTEVDGTRREVFTCHICGKNFPIYKYLKGHLKSHDDVEPYKCPKCHKTFKYHRNFKTHKQGCFNPSGYPCQICSKTLKNEYSLKVHISGVHLNGKADRFPCRKCGVPFSHLPTRTSHEKFCTATGVSNASVQKPANTEC